MEGAIRLLQAVERIYEVMLEEDAECRWLDELRDLVGAQHVCLSSTTENVDWWSCSAFSDTERKIGDRFVHDPIYALSVAQAPMGAPVRISRLVPTGAMLRSDAYEQLIRPMGGGLAVLYAWRQGGQVNAVSICRSFERDQDFSDDELMLVGPLLAHVRNAIRIRTHLLAMDSALRTAHAGLDAIADGVVLLGPTGLVRSLNLAARDILAARDGLGLEGGRLRADRAEDDRRMQRLIQCALRIPGRAGDDRAADAHALFDHVDTSVAIARALSPSPLFVAAAPASGLGIALGDELTTDTATVLLRDPDRRAVMQVEELMRTWRLTRREAQLAIALRTGDTLLRAASRLGVTEGTARQYLKAVFAKTGTHRQAELVGLLMRVGG